MSAAPVMTRWFAAMDSETPEAILDMIAPDFRFSIVFSVGDGKAIDFAGDREAC